MKIRALALSAVLVAGTAGLAIAQTNADLNNEATKMNNLASSQGDGKVIGKISGDFNSFLGSDANALVTGLRNGTPITLTRTTTTPSATPGGLPVTTTNTTVITAPTGQMGHGNVYISLALAKYRLAEMGINEPTPQQLQAALTGGTITQTNGTGATATTTTTELRGILTMRSEKMGWGKIAQELGTKLGPVMSSMKRANYNLANGTHMSSKGHGVATASGQTKESSSGVVSGSGKANANSSHGQSTGKGSGSGIVTASGRSSGGHAYGRSSGVVTGSGHGGGSAGGGASQGGSNNGGGHGKGQGK